MVVKLLKAIVDSSWKVSYYKQLSPIKYCKKYVRNITSFTNKILSSPKPIFTQITSAYLAFTIIFR